MDTIWHRKSFEVGGNWPLWRGWKHRTNTQNRQKSNAEKNPKRTKYRITGLQTMPFMAKHDMTHGLLEYVSQNGLW